MTDSYISAANATIYFGVTKHLYADAWTSASTDEKAAALNMAQNEFEALRWKGRKYDKTQDLQWPRYVKSRGKWNIAVYDDTLETVVIPQFIKDAVCEEANELLVSGNSQRRQLQRAGVSEFWMSKELKEKYNSSGNIKTSGLISWTAYNLVKNWISGSVVIR